MEWTRCPLNSFRTPHVPCLPTAPTLPTSTHLTLAKCTLTSYTRTQFHRLPMVVHTHCHCTILFARQTPTLIHSFCRFPLLHSCKHPTTPLGTLLGRPWRGREQAKVWRYPCCTIARVTQLFGDIRQPICQRVHAAFHMPKHHPCREPCTQRHDFLKRYIELRLAWLCPARTECNRQL